MQRQAARSRPCTYCSEPGADSCVRTRRNEEGGVHIYAHQVCATARGVIPLYLFIDELAPEARQ